MTSPLRTLFRWTIALLSVAVAASFEIAIPGVFTHGRLYPFMAAIVVAALFGGAIPALVSLILTNVFVLYRADGGAFAIDDHALIRLIVFDVISLALLTILASYRRRQLDAVQLREQRAKDLELIANAAPAMTWVSNPERERVLFNRRWLDFTGRAMNAEHADGWLNGVHEEDRDRVARAYADYCDAREPYRIEYRLRRDDGSYRWVDEQAIPRWSSGGVFEGYIGSCVDIHDTRALRQRLDDLIASIPGVVWEAWGDPDTRAQRTDFISDHVERMLGYTVEEWLASPNFWLSIVHPEDRDRAARAAADHYAAGGVSSNVFRWMTRDGRSVWVESRSTVIQDEHGHPLGMRGVTMDISARRRAEDALRFLGKASEELAASLDYDVTLQSAVSLAVPQLADFAVADLLQEDGSLRRVAAVHRDPAKRPLIDRFLAMPPPKSLSFDTAQLMNAVTPELLRASTNAEEAELMAQIGVGSAILAPLRVRDRILGAIAFMRTEQNGYDALDLDIAATLARRIALALENAHLYRTAVDASHAKDEFLATVSHELRTPMTATLGWVRMLQLGNIEPDVRHTALEAIERSTRAQAKLIEDILDVSSIILGKFTFEAQPVDLPSIIDAAIETLRPATQAKKIAIDVDTFGWYGIVKGDAGRLQQVVWNLVANAIKFGRRDGHIAVTLRRLDGVARLTIRDDGQGIDPAFLPHVFDRFRQGDSSITRTHGGLGLGLAIVRHLVELHGGTVQATSEGPGLGATFIIEIPLVEEEPAHLARPAGVELPRLDTRRVLVVDDEVATLDMVSMVLRQCGASVTTAQSADEAMVALHSAAHDLVVTDIAMPGADGVMLLDRIRGGAYTLPAIALTALPDVPAGAGFDRVLRKPIDPFDLAHAVADAMRL